MLCCVAHSPVGLQMMSMRRSVRIRLQVCVHTQACAVCGVLAVSLFELCPAYSSSAHVYLRRF